MSVSVLYLFLWVPWAGLQCVFVVFPDHTHFSTLMARIKYVLRDVIFMVKYGSQRMYRLFARTALTAVD